jgi:nucleotide-binding universal stress UspA family protein
MFQKILIPLDGSPVAERIFHKLHDLTSGDSEVHLLRVANVAQLPGVDPEEMQVNVLKEAEEYLAIVEDRLREEGLRVESHVRYGHPAEEILEHIRHWKYDLIAMTTHGRSGVSRLLMGSVTESVIRKAAIPVLVVRATEVPVEEAAPPSLKG